MERSWLALLHTGLSMTGRGFARGSVGYARGSQLRPRGGLGPCRYKQRAGPARGPLKYQASAMMRQLPPCWRLTIVAPAPLSCTGSRSGPAPAICRSPRTRARPLAGTTAQIRTDSGRRRSISWIRAPATSSAFPPGSRAQGRSTAPASYWAIAASKSPPLTAWHTSSTASAGWLAAGGAIGSATCAPPSVFWHLPLAGAALPSLFPRVAATSRWNPIALWETPGG